MYLYEEKETIVRERTSKLGTVHSYNRTKTVVTFRCDNCGELFRRDRAKMSPKRLSNNYFHCCERCDVKRFAQRKGIEQKQIWDMPASSLQDVSKL